MRKFLKVLRILSAVTLFFFSWTFLPLWQIAAWAAGPPATGGRGDTGTGGNGRRNPAAADPSQSPIGKGNTTGERFEKALESIRENVDRLEKKHALSGVGGADKGEDDTKEREIIKTRRAEIESADSEFKKEFAATEKKLKDAKLPQEILDRHAKFVKHYEDNLKELKTNLDDVEKATTRADRKAKIAKAKLHLEKTKTPSKHVPLDPNKLPHRMVKGKERAPRLKKEEFEKDFGPQRTQKTPRTAGSWDADERKLSRIFNAAIQQKPILLAYNGPASDAPMNYAVDVTPHSVFRTPHWDNSFHDFAFSELNPPSEIRDPQIMFAQATGDLPTAADLAETPEVQFTPEIQARAAELGHNPVKIYEWVLNNIEYAPTYGSIQGADQCLQSRICNDMDAASLLIALLRVSGVYVHYEYSTIEIPIEKAMNWVGGVTDPKMVGTILATNGIPAKNLISGGTIKAVQLEHVYVKAWIDYIPSRGTVHREGDTWIPLDPSFKQYDYKRGMDLYSAMGINGMKYLQDYITDNSTITLSPALQSAFPAYTISPYQYYSKRLFNYVETNLPDSTYQEIFGADTIEYSKVIIKKEYPYLLGTLPYRVTAEGATFSSIPDNMRQRISFSIQNAALSDTVLSYVTTLPQIAGKRVTLSYAPATMVDEALLNQYGTLLNVPPYMLSVKSVLKINGTIVASGSSIGLGQEQTFNMTFNTPNIGTEIVVNKVISGDYSAITILSNKVPVTMAGDKMETLINNIGSSDLDNLLGQMLYNVGVAYFHHLNFEEELYAKNFQMIAVKGLSEAMITSHADAQSLFGVPYNISESGIGIDVDQNEYSTFSYDGSQDRSRDFMIVSGLGSSAWEDRILQAFYDTPSISAARLLRFANQQGVPIYTIDGSNINAAISQLQVSSDVLDDIRNAINAGKKVIISKTSVQYEALNSIGYIIVDPTTGTAGYMIYGGASGGLNKLKPNTSMRNVSQYFWGDGSALRTIYGRTMVVINAMAQLETIYKWKGYDPEAGFDCSGLVHYIFTGVYGKQMFGGQRLSAAEQHSYLLQRKMIHTLADKLDGDILWSDNYKHTGIYYGKLYQGEIVVEDTVIHATSSEFKNGDELKKVVITYTTHPAFTGKSGSIMPDIGRPVPDAILVDIPF
jgi:cell wall-associated NlpC family hydrolase